MAYPKLIEDLIASFTKLPGIGRRSAERMVFYLLEKPKSTAEGLCQDIMNLKEGLMFCRVCHNLSETEVCLICSDIARDDKTICVVETPKDVLAIEKTGIFNGRYHVLHGSISPAEGRGPDDLNIHHLVHRIASERIFEVVIATDPDTEGETTALFLAKELKPTKVKISRIGFGLPVGGSLEYADLSSLSASLTARREID